MQVTLQLAEETLTLVTRNGFPSRVDSSAFTPVARSPLVKEPAGEEDSSSDEYISTDTVHAAFETFLMEKMHGPLSCVQEEDGDEDTDDGRGRIICHDDDGDEIDEEGGGKFPDKQNILQWFLGLYGTVTVRVVPLAFSYFVTILLTYAGIYGIPFLRGRSLTNSHSSSNSNISQAVVVSPAA